MLAHLPKRMLKTLKENMEYSGFALSPQLENINRYMHTHTHTCNHHMYINQKLKRSVSVSNSNHFPSFVANVWEIVNKSVCMCECVRERGNEHFWKLVPPIKCDSYTNTGMNYTTYAPMNRIEQIGSGTAEETNRYR